MLQIRNSAFDFMPTGRSVPSEMVSASSGDLLLRFKTDPLRNGRGWRAIFSADCPRLPVGPNAIASGSETVFGTKITIVCPAGLEFATGVSTIVTECLPGGNWSTGYIPKCQDVYCGPGTISSAQSTDQSTDQSTESTVISFDLF